MKIPIQSFFMEKVTPKKKLGQHFLKEKTIAAKIANALPDNTPKNVLEIGPGTGMLTQFLVEKDLNLYVIDIDKESIAYLHTHFTELKGKIIEGDFLKYDLSLLFKNQPFSIIGNFPYNISSQILFKLLEYKTQIPKFVGTFQEEVAQRVCAVPNNKQYGILSVLLQAFYETKYLFKINASAFYPPPKVTSGVIFLERKSTSIDCDEKIFFKIVKQGFQQRRKTLKNSLKPIIKEAHYTENSIFGKRPEQLSVNDFITLAKIIENDPV